MADQGQSRELLWSSEIKLELLGPVRLVNSAGDDLTPRARKTRGLLAVLALSKGPVARVRLTHLLWIDRGAEQAKASLRQALYELRNLASGGYLQADRESASLGPKALSSDLAAIYRCIDALDADGLADALQGCDYPILGSLDDVTPEFDDWLRDERARISREIIERSIHLAQSCLSANPSLSRRIADQLERLDQVDERVAQLAIRADLAAGDRAAAARRHQRFNARLKDELGLEPSADTDALLRDSSAKFEQKSVRAEARSESIGTGRKRNVLARAAALTLLIGAGIGYMLLRPAPASATPTVAVLPFDDLGRESQSYFASGVSDEILNLLARQQSLKVLGRVSAEQLARGTDSLRTARSLGVGYLLDGSVRSAGDRVLVIARLTRVSDGSQVWSDRYERRIGDIFAVQGDIASAVASHVAQSFTAARPQGTTPAVYDRYLAARQLTRERREVTLREAERLLREAIALDPHYAPAFAELAQVIMLESNHPTAYGSLPVSQARAEAAPFARKAIALDPNLGDSYAALGFLSLTLDADSEPYFQRAVQLSPQRPEFHRWHAETLLARNRYDEGIAEFKRAVDIDPLWGLNYDHLMGALYQVGRKDEARSYEKRFLALSSDERAKQLIILSLQKLDNNFAGELKTAEALNRVYPDERQNKINLAASLAKLGERQRASEIIAFDPLASAAMRGDWTGLARTAGSHDSNFWDQSGRWDTASSLVASGHSAPIPRLYRRDAALVNRL